VLEEQGQQWVKGLDHGQHLTHAESSLRALSLIRRVPSRCSTVRRIVKDMADVNYIHLPPQTFMGSIYGYEPAIPAEPWMRVNPVYAIANVQAPVAFQLGERREMF